MKFKKVYIEITNNCNLNCSFCNNNKRDKKFITVTEFEKIIQEVKQYTKYIYLHVKGEPLLHPNIKEFIKKIKSYGLVGIEVYNPHNKPEHIQFFSEVCDEYGLLKTVGSDYHGRSKEGVEIGLGIDGNLKVDDYSIVTALKQKEKELFY